MRFWVGGPRIFGMRTGISFGPEDLKTFSGARQAGAASEAGTSVYVITSDIGLVKVGLSNNPQSRLATLQTGSGHPLKLAFALPIPNGRAAQVEAFAHNMMADERRVGEWFATTELRATAAVIAGAQYHGIGVEITDPSTGDIMTCPPLIAKSKTNFLKRLLQWIAGFFIGSLLCAAYIPPLFGWPSETVFFALAFAFGVWWLA